MQKVQVVFMFECVRIFPSYSSLKALLKSYQRSFYSRIISGSFIFIFHMMKKSFSNVKLWETLGLDLSLRVIFKFNKVNSDGIAMKSVSIEGSNKELSKLFLSLSLFYKLSGSRFGFVLLFRWRMKQLCFHWVSVSELF